MKKLIISTALIFAAPAVFAQTSDSADLSASVTLEAAQSVSLTKGADINLGVVEIPTTGTCDIEIRGGGDLVGDCVQSGTSSPGLVTVACTPGSTVVFPALGYAPGAETTGVTSNGRIGAAILQDNGLALTTIEANEQFTCPADGSWDIGFLFGIDVDSTASEATDIDLGTVTIEANLG